MLKRRHWCKYCPVPPPLPSSLIHTLILNPAAVFPSTAQFSDSRPTWHQFWLKHHCCARSYNRNRPLLLTTCHALPDLLYNTSITWICRSCSGKLLWTLLVYFYLDDCDSGGKCFKSNTQIFWFWQLQILVSLQIKILHIKHMKILLWIKLSNNIES